PAVCWYFHVLKTFLLHSAAFGICLISCPLVRAQSPESLSGTSRWDFPGDIANEQFVELRSYFEARIAAAAHDRRRYWEGSNWNETVERNRSELRRMTGAVEQFLPLDLKAKQLGSDSAFTCSLVEWPLLRLGNAGPTGGSSTFLVREYGI